MDAIDIVHVKPITLFSELSTRRYFQQDQGVNF